MIISCLNAGLKVENELRERLTANLKACLTGQFCVITLSHCNQYR